MQKVRKSNGTNLTVLQMDRSTNGQLDRVEFIKEPSVEPEVQIERNGKLY